MKVTKEKKIMGTNISYEVTRTFIEKTNMILNGRGRDATEMVVNSLNDRPEILNSSIGEKFIINLQNKLKIIGVKNDYEEVTFISMIKC